MSINLNAIKAGGQRWWRPNLFLNGNFAKEMIRDNPPYTQGDFSTNMGTFGRVESIPAVNGSVVYPVIGKYCYALSRQATISDPQILFLQKIACIPHKIYTVSWWEMNDNPQGIKIKQNESYIYFYFDEYDTTPKVLRLDYTPVQDSSFHRVSVSFKVPDNFSFFQLRLGLSIEISASLNDIVHLAYDGIYVCEGIETPHYWVEAIQWIDSEEDFVYWKNLDDQNKMLHEKEKMASQDHHGFVKLHPGGDFSINPAGELGLQTNIFI